MTVDKGKSGVEGKATAKSGSKSGRGAAFWIVLILVLLALCCVFTLVAAWFSGDAIIEYLRPYIQ